jgi:predicted RNA-binding Zn ribbon-like protein
MAETSPAETRDGFSFRGGHLALDLCATLVARLKPAPRDLLAAPVDLARWLRAAGLGSARECAIADLAQARELREAVFTLAMARIAASSAPRSTLALLNRHAALQAAVPQLESSGRLRLVGDTRALLAGIAQEAVRLLGSPAAALIHQCEAATCSRLFLDLSRAGDRRWCSMSPCGNRAKVAAFRRRQRGA